MAGLIYDTGMLVALDRGVQRAWRLHEQVNAAGGVPVVPVVVLAQAWRGGPQPRLSRALRGCRHVGVTESLARAAGTLCGRAGASDVIDAMVAVLAAQLDAAVITSDPNDLAHLSTVLGHKFALHTI
jgi:predicted nucleic acid-binding protein